MEEKIKQKRGLCGVGDTVEIAWDVGSVSGSSSLGVDAIRAVDIFIGGCYLWCPGFLGRGKENKAILILFL